MTAQQKFEALLSRLEPAIRAAFLAAIADLRSTAQVTTVTGHLERGDIEAAIAALNIRPEFFAPLDDALRVVYLQGGVDAIATLSKLARPFSLSGRFSGSTAETLAPNRTSPSNPRVS